MDGVVVNTMEYDGYGNILSKNGKVYTYGDDDWKDKLTAYDGQAITYDAQGNPVSYLGHTLTWEKGRQLKSFDSNTYTYNANGIRTSKTVNGVKHTYTLDGTKIITETWQELGEDNTEQTRILTPLYDNEESVCGIMYGGALYYFLKNLQGDIIAITNQNGVTLARYAYDAWGACTIIEDNSNCNIATINPFRYRGYYYDAEIGMYYLQSRYFDCEIGRFINADNQMMQSVVGTHLFAYCENNAICCFDPCGTRKKIVIDPGHGGEVLGALGYAYSVKKVGLLLKKYVFKIYYEKNFNLKVSLHLRSLLSCANFLVYMTRATDVNVGLDSRWQYANRIKADLFISIHHNSSSPLKKGYLTLYAKKHDEEKSKKLAQYISETLGKFTRLRKHASPASNNTLAVLNGTKMPAVMVECGFMGGDLEYCRSNSYAIAYAIYRGIVNYTNK